MNESLLGLKIGSARKKVTVIDMESKRFAPEDKNDRLYVHTVAPDGAPYKVSEIWIKDHKQDLVYKGLWVDFDDTGIALHRTSTLVRLLQYVGVASLPELVGKEVYLEPKPNGFMAIVAYDDSTV